MKKLVAGGFWSKQHHRIRTPRPHVDYFDLSVQHPSKQWWRERRISPETFLGYANPAKVSSAGMPLLVEQMDVATLVLTLSKCQPAAVDFQTLQAWSARARQLAGKLSTYEAILLFRRFGLLGHRDESLSITLFGRINQSLLCLSASDCSQLLVRAETEFPALRSALYERLRTLLAQENYLSADEYMDCIYAIVSLGNRACLRTELRNLVRRVESLEVEDFSHRGRSLAQEVISTIMDKHGDRLSKLSSFLQKKFRLTPGEVEIKPKVSHHEAFHMLADHNYLQDSPECLKF